MMFAMKGTTMSKIKNVLLGLAALAAMALGAGAIAQAGDKAASSATPSVEANDSSDAGDRSKAITGRALDRASKIALQTTGGGKVTETEKGDEESYYQVEVTLPNGNQTDVNLDRRFNVVHTKTEGPEGPGDD
jgi:uncharacterized membrane protein YkoI